MLTMRFGCNSLNRSKSVISQSCVLIRRQKTFHFLLLLIGCQVAFAGSLPEYTDIKTAIGDSWKVRSELLNHSSGIAKLSIQKSVESWQEREVKSIRKKLTGQGADPDKINFFSGKGEWTTTWFKKGLKNRYDVVVPPSKKKEPGRKPLILERDKRIVATPERGWNYNLLSKKAVINFPASKATNPYSLLGNFDIEKLYQIRGHDILDELDFWDKKKGDRKITRDKIGQVNCIKIEYNSEKVVKGRKGLTRKKRIVFWFSPEMSYSLVKSHCFCNNITSPDELTLICDYEASYEESETFKGVWLLKDIAIIDKDGPVCEKLTANLTETKIGIDISDETFTFEGLGVPPGTPVYDRSAGGKALKYYYRSYPVGEIDDLAATILSQEEVEEKLGAN